MQYIQVFVFLSVVMSLVGAFMDPIKESYLTDALLREVVHRMGNHLQDAYLDLPQDPRSSKVLENEEISYPLDLANLGQPSTSLRDREYLQHSSLFGSQYRHTADPALLGQQVKTDPTLPAYCNPPNPCPVGYTGDDGCIEDFENSAAFSRDYQAAQDCMCDSEHMFDCPAPSGSKNLDVDDMVDVDSILNELQVADSHKSLVAKKFSWKKESNPYLTGEKLPIAAKKGINLLNL